MSRTDFSRLFDQLEALSIGFGPVFRDFQTPTSNYPPHNIYQLEPNQDIILEIAVAGFKRDEITVREIGGELTVQGLKPEIESTDTYTYRGIAARNFVKRFRLADYYETDSAKLEDGLLSIKFVKNAPKDPKIIAIS